MVELITSPAGQFQLGFRLSVTHHRRRRKTKIGNILSPCQHSIIDGNGQELSYSGGWRKQGSFVGPRYWFARNTDCTWSLITSAKEDRIWVEMHTRKMISHPSSSSLLFVNSSDPMSDGCLFNRLEINGQSESSTVCGISNLSTSTERLSFHDFHFPEHVTLLNRDRVDIRFTSRLGSLTGNEFDFNVFYMFLPAKIEGDSESICDRAIGGDASDGESDVAGGTLHLIEDRLLLRQNKRLACRYRFQV